MVTFEKEREILAEYILTNKKVKIRSGKVEVDGFQRTRTATLKEFYPAQKDWTELGLERLFSSQPIELKTLGGDVFDIVKQKSDSPMVIDQGGFATSVDHTKLIPCIDLKTAKYVMYNPDTDRVSDINYDAWMKRVPVKLREPILEQTRDCVFKYNPYNVKSYEVVSSSLGEFAELNTCILPAYMYEPSKVTPKLPPLFIKFITNLFTTNGSRQYAIDWMYTSNHSRCATYLVLNGRKGVGKGLLTTALSKLVGENNYVETPRSFINSNFNDLLANNRIVVVDETKIENADHRNKLKSYLNRLQMVEGKHMPAVQVELFCSMVLSNNDYSDLRIEQDDRRFSVMDLCEKSLPEMYTKDEVDELWEVIEREEFPEAFNGYLKEKRSKNFQTNLPFKGETFNKLVLTSLYNWQSALMDTILTKERDRYCYNELVDNIHMFPRTSQKVMDFLKNFKVEDVVLGTVGRENGKNYIFPSDKFKPERNEDDV